ncbi:MAG: tetratricopeptide repeat protein [Bryobacteraceae bacterium]|jgi:tetratricopeptide (TPR) repeat protein
MSLSAGIPVIPLFLAAVLIVGPAFSQSRGGAGSIGPAGMGATTPNQSTLSVSTTWQLSGRVTFEDGTVPTQPVYVESVCNGIPRKEAKIDPQGGFSFRLGRGSGDSVMNAENAADHLGAGAVTSANECVIRASLPGFTSDRISLVGHEEHHPDLGTIMLHKNGEGSADSATSKQAPKDARKAFDKASQAAKARKFDEAAKDYQTAVSLFPGYAEAWYQLGQAQIALKQTGEARKSLNAAIQADEKYITPYLQLADLEMSAQNWNAVVDVTGRMLKLAPAGYPQAYLMNGMASYQLHDADGAEKSARAGLQIDRSNQAPKLYQVLASVLLVHGDYAGAATQLKKYLEVAPTAQDASMVRAQIAQLEARAGGPAKQ